MYINFELLDSESLQTKFQGNWPNDFEEEDFQVFYRMWAWQPSWSRDLDYINIPISFS